MSELDVAGRCCGRKPIAYKRPPRLFCPRCDRAFDPANGRQIANWHWMEANGVFLPIVRIPEAAGQ